MSWSARRLRRAARGLLLLAAACLACASPAGTDPAVAARIRQAQEEIHRGRLDSAAEILEKLLEEHPDQVDALVALARLEQAEGRFAEAGELYLRLTRLRPGNGLYAFRAGTALEAAGRFRSAGELLERAAELRSQDPDVHYRLGLHRFAQGDHAGALQALSRADELQPLRADVGMKLAQTLEHLGRPEEAIAHLQEVVPRHPDDVFLLFVRGLIRSRAGDSEAAAADLADVVQAAPDLIRARYALARALLAAGRREEGEREMQHFIDLDGKRREEQTLVETVELAAASDDDDPVRFRRRMEALVRSHPGSAAAHRHLAQAYSREGDHQSAAASYGRAARIDPDDHDSRLEQGRLLLRSGRPGEALAVLQDAQRRAPQRADIAALLQEARRRAGGKGT